MATTPPPASHIHSPPAPRHGASNDQWDPYVNRRSTRSSVARSNRNITPPPAPRIGQGDSSLRRGKMERNSNHALSPPPSTRSSPRDNSKGRFHQAGHRKSDEHFSTASTAASNIDDFDSGSLAVQSLADSDAAMLPTPAKTPVKRSSKSAAGIQSTARVLFRSDNVDELMPANKRRKSGRHVGFTLDSFDGGSQAPDEDIEIYTDSKERIPELDTSEDNPFWDDEQKVVVPAAPKKAGKGKKLSSELAGMIGREDGYVATFRGKSFFTKFEDSGDAVDEPESATSKAEEEQSLKFKRACAQPRTLFKEEIQKRAHERSMATRSKSANNDIFDDEEAMTDIEEVVDDSYLNDPLLASLTSAKPTNQSDILSTPSKPRLEEPSTPVAFNSFTPPTTLSPARRTRSTHPSVWDEPESVPTTPEADESATSAGKRPSPFDVWTRTKPSSNLDRTNAGVSKAKKRHGSTLEKAKSVAKRAKGDDSS